MRENIRERPPARNCNGEKFPGTSRGEEGLIRRTTASGWQVATSRKQRTEHSKSRTDVARSYRYYKKEAKRTTYFFTRFPDNFMAKHMLQAFLKYGDFEEVVIPAKRDRFGRRFGFARAVDVRDPENFATKLDNIIIRSEKILVNLPRFDRQAKNQFEVIGDSKKPDGAVSYPNKEAQKNPPLNSLKPNNDQPIPSSQSDQPQPVFPNQSYPKTNNLSSKIPPDLHSTFKHNQKQWNGKKRYQNRFSYIPPPQPKRPWAHRKFSIDESVVKRYDNTYVGVVEKPGSTYRIQEEVIQQGYFSLRATAMGANLVLLESLVEGEIEAVLEEAKEWLATRFSDIRKWNPNEVDNECLTWVKCYGIPVHAWSEEFFKFIVLGIGEFVTADENTEKRRSMDVARILIRRKRHDVINFTERFEINGDMFVIKVIEDWFAPQESTWKKLYERDSDSSSNSDIGSGDDYEDLQGLDNDQFYSEEEADIAANHGRVASVVAIGEDGGSDGEADEDGWIKKIIKKQ